MFVESESSSDLKSAYSNLAYSCKQPPTLKSCHSRRTSLGSVTKSIRSSTRDRQCPKHMGHSGTFPTFDPKVGKTHLSIISERL